MPGDVLIPRLLPEVINQTSGSFSFLLVEKLPFLLLTVGASIVTYFVQQEGGAVSAIPFSARLANGLLSYVRYIGKTIWPTELAVYYPLPGNLSLRTFTLRGHFPDRNYGVVPEPVFSPSLFVHRLVLVSWEL